LTLQITIDRILLSRSGSDAVAAALPAAVLFWIPMALLQNIANYATTFVAQYTGADRPQRVGPAVWQALYFSVGTGVAFLGLLPLAGPLLALGEHSAAIQEQEVVYFRCLCFAALPMLLVAAASSFFAGRGDSWTVLRINAVGFAVNALLSYTWIYGHWGFPALGIAGAGWATVAGSTASAVLSLVLLFRPRYRAAYCTGTGWRFEPALFGRLMRFGLPNGLQWMVDALAFEAFLVLVGRLGDAELAATGIALSINMVAFLPSMGVGQAVAVLVGQRLGQNRPELAERSTWTGFWTAWLFMSAVSLLYALVPEVFLVLFRSDDAKWPAVERIVPSLLRFVAIYSLFDSMNAVFSFALRGAGDTRFVTLVWLGLSWPLMVIPTWAAWYYGWGIYWAWGFASSYVIALGIVFLLRFRTGKWKAMRVIEAAPKEEDTNVGDTWGNEP
jgi:MATE family multidrug resistance protein